MKKITLLTVLITILISCSKEVLTTNPIKPNLVTVDTSLGSFIINKKEYGIKTITIDSNSPETLIIINSKYDAFNSNNYKQFRITYINDSNSNYSMIFKENDLFTLFYDQYKNQDVLNNPIVYSDRSKIKCIKNSNGTFKVLGTIKLYNSIDTTDIKELELNFITTK
jgi:hypothetical protein